LESTVQNLMGLLSQRSTDEPCDLRTDDSYPTKQSTALFSTVFGDEPKPVQVYNDHDNWRTQYHASSPYLEPKAEPSTDLLRNYEDDARMDELDDVEVGINFVLT
jgi:hypothetical protein